jgi:hypothetical protein
VAVDLTLCNRKGGSPRRPAHDYAHLIWHAKNDGLATGAGQGSDGAALHGQRTIGLDRHCSADERGHRTIV